MEVAACQRNEGVERREIRKGREVFDKLLFFKFFFMNPVKMMKNKKKPIFWFFFLVKGSVNFLAEICNAHFRLF